MIPVTLAHESGWTPQHACASESGRAVWYLGIRDPLGAVRLRQPRCPLAPHRLVLVDGIEDPNDDLAPGSRLPQAVALSDSVLTPRLRTLEEAILCHRSPPGCGDESWNELWGCFSLSRSQHVVSPFRPLLQYKEPLAGTRFDHGQNLKDQIERTRPLRSLRRGHRSDRCEPCTCHVPAHHLCFSSDGVVDPLPKSGEANLDRSHLNSERRGLQVSCMDTRRGWPEASITS